MRNTKAIKKLLVGSVFGAAILVGASSVSAQNRNEEYREWQEAQRRATEEQRDYYRTRRARDYRDWQQAQRRANRERIEYQRSQRRRNYRNNNDYNNGNNGYYNNGNDGYYNNNNRTGVRRYRVMRNGQYYQTNQRGAELLRQAVNSGYQQGYRQGQIERQNRRHSNYYGNQYYRRGDYGYQSYVDRSQYQYYFQQGFQRGYQDGYNRQSQYGYQSGNNFNILGTVLSSIFNLVID